MYACQGICLSNGGCPTEHRWKQDSEGNFFQMFLFAGDNVLILSLEFYRGNQMTFPITQKFGLTNYTGKIEWMKKNLLPRLGHAAGQNPFNECVYVSVCLSLSIYIHIYISPYIYTYIHTHTYIHTYISISIYICVCVCARACASMCPCACACVCVCIFWTEIIQRE